MALIRAHHLALAIALTACGAGAAAPKTAPLAGALVLQGEEGALSLEQLAGRAPYTVLLFFSGDCPVQKAHDARLRELVASYQPKGVAFVAVASETDADVARLRAELGKRGLAMPLVEDRGAKLADQLAVEYSTHVVLLDRERHPLYSGGIDDERSRLTDHAKPWLRSALEDTLAGRPVATARTEPLGCPLSKH